MGKAILEKLGKICLEVLDNENCVISFGGGSILAIL